MTCQNCGKPISPEDNFCIHCGSSVKISPPSAGSVVVTVGRNRDNNIVIQHQNVSGHHASFRIEKGIITLEDLNSSNGTFVNGKKIIISKVSRNDHIRFGADNYFDWGLLEPYLTPKEPNYTPAPRIEPPVTVNSSSVESYTPAQEIPPKPVISENKKKKVQKNNPYQSEFGNQVLLAVESGKSYVSDALIALMMYIFLFWIVGFIMNLVYLNQASRTKQVIGRSPSGYGCLVSLLIVFGILPLTALIVFLIAGASILSSF